MVKALLIKKTGGPEVLKPTEIKFRAPNKNEALVKHTVIGVNYIDIEQRSGFYNLRENASRLRLPAIVGCQAVGVVKALGEGASADVKPGDRVCYTSIPYGAYSDERVIHLKYLHKIPDYLSDVDVAACLHTGMLSFYLTCRAYLVRDGITVMVHAVDTDVGDMLCQWIKARAPECKIVGTVSSRRKIESIKNIRCDMLLNYSDDLEVLREKVQKFTRGYGVSAVYDCIGKDTYLFSLNSLCTFGIYVLYEQRSGEIPPMSWKAFRARSLFFTHPSLFHYSRNHMESVLAVAEVFHYMKTGKIVPNIANRYKGLEQIHVAHKEIEAGNVSGATVVLL
ncbi:zinc-binding dehydrogenase family protein [Neorickettsia helminthoeca str. Oregon]|uniref:Zinc-binding dehydrogenase family protein n=1 Tax=Neorickettsia helminthoeca str. Oregon TaxID=1286528 RepID=X5HLM5_9RICK|nr:quinone oxidoreductase [Neorickettsia helminthoeca]AHX11315.1 zinc-binding dehydrogenase family protein [Neorickettsia helminthoeca str. Oregon]